LLLVPIAIWGARARERTLGRGPIVISLHANLATTLDPPNLRTLVALERRIKALPGVQTATGPGTFIQASVEETNRAIRRDLAAVHASGPAVQRQRLNDLLVRYGYTGVPSIDNGSFVGQLIFGSGTQPKQSLGWLFPDNEHALVLVGPRAGLSDALTHVLGDQIRRLVQAVPLQGVSASVTL
jgi:hypothetical protein